MDYFYDMNTPYKFVSPLDEAQTVLLKNIIKNDTSARARVRAQSILLSAKGYGIDEIACIFDIYRNAVSSWISKWEEQGIESLYDKPRSGSPPILTDSEIETVKKIVNEHPHSPEIILAQITEQTGKTVSMSTLKRIIKKAGLRRKRVRKSVKNRRDGKEFEEAEKETVNLREQQKSELIDLFCFDETGFSPDSRIPYTYRHTGETVEINSSKRKKQDGMKIFHKLKKSASQCGWL